MFSTAESSSHVIQFQDVLEGTESWLQFVVRIPVRHEKALGKKNVKRPLDYE